MALNSNISWCDHTINLWWGCSKVHTGCKNCYAENLSDKRYKKNLWGDKGSRQRIVSAFKDLDKCQKLAAKENTISKIFCGSMMDIFEDDFLLENPSEFFFTTNDLRQELFKRIDLNFYPNLVFLFLTKRPKNIYNLIPEAWRNNHPKNVWFGASVSDQKTYTIMCADLIELNSTNLFLSCEPQTDLIEIGANAFSINWIIQGGESGPNKRAFNLNWAYVMKQRCKQANIPFFFKQIDKVLPIPNDLICNEFPNF